MQVGPLCAVAIFGFAVSLADTAELNHYSPCQEDKVMDCLAEKFQGIEDAEIQQDFDGVVKIVCTGKREPCTDIHATPACPDEDKKALAVVEESLAAAFDALCANDGALLKKLPQLFECWNLATFVSCVERIPLKAYRFDFFTSKRTAEDVQILRVELPKCIDLSRSNATACASASIEPAQKFLDTFLDKSVPGYSGNVAAQAGSSLAAFLSVVVALLFSRHA